MRASLTFLSEKFDLFNKMIFKKPLPRPMMHISSARSFLGQFKTELHGDAAKKKTYHLTLSNRYDLPETELEDIVIHEMIHYHISYNNLRDTSSHGRLFQKLMNEINTRFGRHISVSHRCTKEQLDSDKVESRSIVCLCMMKDGRKLLCKPANSRIFSVHRTIKECDDIESEEWYSVCDSYFNRFRKTLTPKFYKADETCISKIRAGKKLVFTKSRNGALNLVVAK